MTRPDPIDEAAECEHQMIEIALANRKLPEMQFTGTCYNCEESSRQKLLLLKRMQGGL